jgi:preprotein translocase subunit YajC
MACAALRGIALCRRLAYQFARPPAGIGCSGAALEPRTVRRNEESWMFTTPAYAQGIGGFTDPSALMQFAPLVLIFVVFYFLLIRPQQQKAKQHKAELSKLRRGDKVVTGGGFIGTIAKVVNDEEVQVDLAENIRVRVIRSTISSVISRTEPVADKEEAAEEAPPGKEKRKGGARGG